MHSFPGKMSRSWTVFWRSWSEVGGGGGCITWVAPGDFLNRDLSTIIILVGHFVPQALTFAPPVQYSENRPISPKCFAHGCQHELRGNLLGLNIFMILTSSPSEVFFYLIFVLFVHVKIVLFILDRRLAYRHMDPKLPTSRKCVKKPRISSIITSVH